VRTIEVWAEHVDKMVELLLNVKKRLARLSVEATEGKLTTDWYDNAILLTPVINMRSMTENGQEGDVRRFKLAAFGRGEKAPSRGDANLLAYQIIDSERCEGEKKGGYYCVAPLEESEKEELTFETLLALVKLLSDVLPQHFYFETVLALEYLRTAEIYSTDDLLPLDSKSVRDVLSETCHRFIQERVDPDYPGDTWMGDSWWHEHDHFFSGLSLSYDAVAGKRFITHSDGRRVSLPEIQESFAASAVKRFEGREAAVDFLVNVNETIKNFVGGKRFAPFDFTGKKSLLVNFGDTVSSEFYEDSFRRTTNEERGISENFVGENGVFKHGGAVYTPSKLLRSYDHSVNHSVLIKIHTKHLQELQTRGSATLKERLQLAELQLRELMCT
jgi:hypothetical protein